MSTRPSTTSAAAALADELHRRLPGGRVLTGAAYDQSRRIWNGAIDHAPAVIVRPQTRAEVQTAVRAARHHGVPLSVRGGGHDWAGRALREGGLVIDLTAMAHVTVDPLSRVATVQGGVTAGGVIGAAHPHGLTAVTGTVGAVGMTGLTLGGGYGPLMGRYGLALDNLLGAEVVLADGRAVTATQEEEPELYWALRGGGGNFGVVTSLSLRLHPVPEVLAGLIVYPWSDAVRVWTQLDDILAAAPDELTVQTGILAGPDGRPTVFVSPVWCGDLSDGERVIEPLQSLSTPLMVGVAPTSYVELLRQFDSFVVDGRHYAARTRNVGHLTPEVIAALFEAGRRQTSRYSGIVVHHFHGAATRVPLSSTAFGLRAPHRMIEIVATWEPGDDAAAHVDWAERVDAELAPHALPGGYPNMLGPDAPEQTAHAYGSNAARLAAAKQQFDPDGVFTAIALPA
ncbi:FAD-linked oxidase [Mycobacterium triplex]|uniref:6-hydroxy-D-nicotine oxidase n=1 Tax=Mycobacterium triplex TaxID=47839 RepID=A0A024K5M2_9MYCO|nr:FAD-binding oxidoreductase [Mycobacterium triplex]ORX04384.1 FAD-linked oxidase [Mycobacterium triplex]CDO90887.1 6-hydroxy-D-nicotine oxidase [Mycobacterium triplex]